MSSWSSSCHGKWADNKGKGLKAGEIFRSALNRMGYYLYGYRHFSSRIKGGHSNNKIRISTTPSGSISDDLNVLVAFDQETIDFNAHELVESGVILADAKFNPKCPRKGARTTLCSSLYRNCPRSRHGSDEKYGGCRCFQCTTWFVCRVFSRK